MFLKSRLVLGCLASSMIWGVMHPVMANASSLSVIWGVTSPEQELKAWDFQALEKLKTLSAQEKDPNTGKVTHYRGVLLSEVLEKAMDNLPGERKAQVDLVVLKSAAGGQVLLPRSVVTRYPVLLALQNGQASLVMPWTSKPKIMQEGLPVETYFIGNVTRVELSNYHERFGGVFLRRRTDPLAMRGEKIFVQNCMGCHVGTPPPSLVDVSGELQARRLASVGHPEIKGSPKLNDRDRRALVNYLDAYRIEKQATRPMAASK